MIYEITEFGVSTFHVAFGVTWQMEDLENRQVYLMARHSIR